MGRLHTIENRKGKQDAKRAQIFTKYARLITVAAKEGGADPEYNPSLKNAIDKAKAENMPNDNIERAIKKGAGGDDSENYESITYEGYGPGGVAMIVETLTDNKNRTAGNVRHYFDRHSGNLGTTGSVSFMFDRKGEILVEKKDSVVEDELMEVALDAGAMDFITEDDCYVIYTEAKDFPKVKDALTNANYELLSADVKLIPATYAQIDESQEKMLEKLLDELEEDDDVQNVYYNIK
ncbi:YebC/PmpR family DNA-binding transcriptional regulator [Criibacterium bergeronii]|uniref:Probable transcriptional regulatory protein BBG48_002310 n=1 Tax=Criibacterium bergeronii TaxID=1871336 RepID=A0A371IN56_9FIRM|nr:YebC/PmpR family DNA-binding transcriptional regulator [Criibacterium bergeronii]MBS6062569.1 YebC/PmpR family DNA-binding transcriptional regulator [Peptostreptococcaceae bacterium]RDY21925.1 YebC/PmpR family DNA-binding transcriptional regulator [Criibacterium bergeronii]